MSAPVDLNTLYDRRRALEADLQLLDQKIKDANIKEIEQTNTESLLYVSINDVKICVDGGFASVIETCPEIYVSEYYPVDNGLVIPKFSWEHTKDERKNNFRKRDLSAGGSSFKVELHLDESKLPLMKEDATLHWLLGYNEPTVAFLLKDTRVIMKYNEINKTICFEQVTIETTSR